MILMWSLFLRWQINNSIRIILIRQLKRKSEDIFQKQELKSHHIIYVTHTLLFSCDYNEDSFVTLDNAGSFCLIQQDKSLLAKIIHLDTLIRRKVYLNIILAYLRQITSVIIIGCGHIIST